MIKIWHFIYYSIYRLDYKLHLFTNKINPILYIYKIDKVKNYFNKKGKSPVKDFNKSYENRDYGFSILLSQIIIHSLLFALLVGIFNLSLIIFNIFIDLKPFMFMAILVVSISLNLLILIRNKDYKKSFLEFDNYKKERKAIYFLLSFVAVISIFMLSYLSFVYGSKHHSLNIL